MWGKSIHLLFLLGLTAWVCCSSHVGAQSHFPTLVQRDDLYSATHKLEGLAGQEEEIVQMLQTYIADTRLKLDDMQQYIAAYHNLVAKNDAPVVKFVSNPIDAYLLLKRLTVDWGQVESALVAQANLTHSVLNTIMGLRVHSQFPVEEDLHGAAVALVRLQDTYKLNMTDLTHGLIKGTSEAKLFHSRNVLGARDCLFLARHAYEKGYYDTSIDWGEAAAELALEEGDEKLIHQIKNFNDMAVRVHDEILEKRGPLGPDWQTRHVPADPQSKSIPTARSEHALGQSKFIPKLYQFQNEQEENDHYERLCRGEKLRPAFMESELKCFTTTRNKHPYLVLQPLKIEEKSLDPYVVVIHDLLRDESINLLKNLAAPKLMTSKHKTPQGYVSSMIRTSKNAWIQEAEHPSLTKIRKRMEISTGLAMQNYTAAEEFQVANYGIGGLYVTHLDNVISDPNPANNDPYNLRVGDRIATLMVYLTDVEAGGATVFPRAGVTTWPEKGAAAFWWNLYRNGQADDNTRHGACPVLYGSKWVSNKWVRAYEQMFQAPCGLQRLEKYTLI